MVAPLPVLELGHLHIVVPILLEVLARLVRLEILPLLQLCAV
jgi:hypothetical protein